VVSEAKERWGISEKKMLELLSNGVLEGVHVENGVVSMPDYQGIKFPKRNQRLTQDSISKMILEACENLHYTDYHLLAIPEENFSAILQQMERDNLIERQNSTTENFSSNQNYICTEKGRSSLKKRKIKLTGITINLDLKFLGFEINLKTNE
ncbi:MAG: hypothetical protein K2O42_09200, partial [Oscillospiraceae bacterium]|nr:hypothetical protein [Oscillospiraceae bacterium]